MISLQVIPSVILFSVFLGKDEALIHNLSAKALSLSFLITLIWLTWQRRDLTGESSEQSRTASSVYLCLLALLRRKSRTKRTTSLVKEQKTVSERTLHEGKLIQRKIVQATVVARWYMNNVHLNEGIKKVSQVGSICFQSKLQRFLMQASPLLLICPHLVVFRIKYFAKQIYFSWLRSLRKTEHCKQEALLTIAMNSCHCLFVCLFVRVLKESSSNLEDSVRFQSCQLVSLSACLATLRLKAQHCSFTDRGVTPRRTEERIIRIEQRAKTSCTG